MASKVNVKFVVLLSAVLGLVFVGVAGAFVYIKLKSGDRYIRLGDSKLAAGDITGADVFYARAVGKDPARVDWLVKWRDVRRKKIPETQTVYAEDYDMYMSILRTLAIAQRTDVGAHREYLEELYNRASASGGADWWRHVAHEAEAAMRYFEPEHPATLRRFRGVATVTLMAGGADVPQAEQDAARDDLEAALKADPKDGIAAYDLAVWHRLAANKLRADNNKEGADRELAESRGVIDALVAAAPDAPLALVLKTTMDISAIESVEDPKKKPDELNKVRMAMLDGFKPRVAELAARLARADPGELTLDSVSRLYSLALGVDPKEGPKQVLAVVDRALEGNRASADLMMFRSQLLAMTANPEGAIAQDDAIIALPRKPVSLEGARQFDLQRGAMFMKANSTMGLALNAKEEDRPKIMARITECREQLARNVAEHAPELTLVDGKMKYLQRDYPASQRLLSEFLKAPGSLGNETTEALMLSSDVAAKLGQVGLAIDQLEQVSQRHPNSVEILGTLAQMNMQLQRQGAALELYKRVLLLDPENKAAKDALGVLNALSLNSNLEDPVMQVLVNAERLVRGDAEKLGDEQAALDLLEKAIETTGADPRIVLPVARMKAARNDLPGAKAALEAGLAKHPDDQNFQAALSQVNSGSTLEGTLALFEAQGGSPADKQWNRFRVYTSFHKDDEADAALSEFAKLAPKDPRAIEAQFLRASKKGDTAEAQRLVDLAVETDADRVGGDTYRGRMMLAQGNLRECSVLLERATSHGNPNQGLLRLLGIVQLELGRQEEGAASLKQALALNPTDLTTIKTSLECLTRLNRTAEALALARQSQLYAQRDPDFLNGWLALEAATGNSAFAIERREQIMARNAGDLANGVALADLYMDARQWEKARALLDKLRPGNEAQSMLAEANARWHADRGDMDQAREVFVALIGETAKRQDPQPPGPYLVFGQFMLQHGRTDWGLAALRQAERLQDPKTMEVSEVLGDALIGLAQFVDAEQTYRKIIDAKVPDPRLGTRKRLIECLVQQRKLQEAEAEFVALGARAEDDAELLAQRAQTARGAGDTKRARELLDRAITKFPTEPLPYIRRARLLMADPAMARDAVADLDTAVKLRPTSWQARRTRALLFLSQGQVEEGLKDLQVAVESNPTMDALRLDYIEKLLELKRELEAVDAADAGIKPRPSDAHLIGSIAERFVAAADQFTSTGDLPVASAYYARASRYYKMVWQQLGDEASATGYVQTLLKSSPPSVAEAEAVLSKPSLNTERSADLLLVRAALRAKQTRESDARADALAALDRSTGSRAKLALWTAGVRRMFPEPRAAQALFQAARVPVALGDWLKAQQAISLSKEPATRSEGEAALELLLASTPDRDVKLEICGALTNLYTTDNKWPEAMAATKKGLELNPADPGYNNNAAFLLSEQMNQPKEALPYAEKAQSLDPTNDSILDTLAAVHWRLGNRDKAMQFEAEALRRGRREADKARWAFILAGWKLQAGDKVGARGLLDNLHDILSENPALVAEFKPNVDKLEKDIQAAR